MLLGRMFAFGPSCCLFRPDIALPANAVPVAVAVAAEGVTICNAFRQSQPM
jgi:hypothetical protein